MTDKAAAAMAAGCNSCIARTNPAIVTLTATLTWHLPSLMKQPQWPLLLLLLLLLQRLAAATLTQLLPQPLSLTAHIAFASAMADEAAAAMAASDALGR